MSRRVIKKLTPFEEVDPTAAILMVNLVDPQLPVVKVFLEAIEEKAIPYFIVGNKIDLVDEPINLSKFFSEEIIYTSMITGQGLERVKNLIKKKFKRDDRIIVLGVFNSGKTSLIANLTGLKLKIGDLPGTTLKFEEYPYEDYILIDTVGQLIDINKPLMVSIDFSNCNSIDEKINKVFEEEIDGLKRTLISASPQIKKAVEILRKSIENGNKLITIGAGASALVAMEMASQALETGVPAMTFTNNLAQAQPISFAKGVAEEEASLSKYISLAVNEGDVVVGISASGGTGFVYHALKICKEKGAKTIAITENPDTPLGKFADLIIKSDTKPEGPSASKTQIAHLAIVHSIILTLADERKIRAEDSINFMLPERVPTKKMGIK